MDLPGIKHGWLRLTKLGNKANSRLARIFASILLLVFISEGGLCELVFPGDLSGFRIIIIIASRRKEGKQTS